MVDKESTIEKIDAYEYLLKKPFDSLSTLKKQVGEVFVNYLQRTGIIKFGLNSAAEKRYQVTSRGERIIMIELRSLYLKMI